MRQAKECSENSRTSVSRSQTVLSLKSVFSTSLRFQPELELLRGRAFLRFLISHA